jgi:hypothetical protein
MKKYIILLIIGFALFATSCTLGKFSYKAVPATSFSPQIVKLELTLDQFEYLGETEISVNQKTYLGIFTILDSINGLPKDYHHKKFTQFYGNKDIPVKGAMKRAAYKVVEDFPDADYYIPVNYQKNIYRMFLGSRKTTTMTIKAYKFRY